MAENDPDNFAKTTVELALRLGVSRQALHTWRKRANAPHSVGGFWNVAAWKRFIDDGNLAPRETVSRTTAVIEICHYLTERLPVKMSRREFRQFKKGVASALHCSCRATRFAANLSGVDRSPNGHLSKSRLETE